MKPLSFDPHYHLEQIILVGCGGTGSEWARLLARTLYIMQGQRRHLPRLLLVDPDVVEPSNVGRQLYAPGDAGENKSAVLARRFSQALGLEISYCPHPFEPGLVARGSSVLLCGAVDNHLARRALAQVRNAIWIEAGNHHSSGSVCIGSIADARQVAQTFKPPLPATGEIHTLPNAALLFPELLDPDPEETQTPAPAADCAVRVAQGQQHLLINGAVAAVAGWYSHQILMRQPITTFLTWISLDPPAIRSCPITPDEVLGRLQRSPTTESERRAETPNPLDDPALRATLLQD